MKMRRMKQFTGTVALLSLLASQLWVGVQPAFSEEAVTEQPVTHPEVVPGKVIVKYKQPVKNDSDIRPVNPLVSEDPTVKTMELPLVENVWEKVEELNNDPNVEFAQPVYVYRLELPDSPSSGQQSGSSSPAVEVSSVVTANDPGFDNQWGLAVSEAAYAWAQVSAEERSRIKIAVVDTGVNLSHPDLTDSIDRIGGQVNGYDFFNNDADPNDDHGHGTHVAGIAAAVTDNAVGVAGMAGGVKIMPIKVANANGAATTLTIASGIKWAVDHGASVINLSMSRDRFQRDEQGRIVLDNGGVPIVAWDQIESEALQYARDHQVLVVAASGNDSNHWIGNDALNLNNPTGDTERHFTYTGFPAGMDGVVSVGAVDLLSKTGRLEDDVRLADFSNIGFVSVVAPGVGILSSVPGGYQYKSGTSMATPFVTGLAALLKAANPSLTSEQLYDVVTDSAVRLPELANGDYLNGYHPTAKDDYGSGLINGRRAFMLPRLQLQMSSDPNQLNRTFTLTSTDQRGTVTGVTYELSAGLNVSKYRFSNGLWEAAPVQSVTLSGGKGTLTIPQDYGRYRVYADDGAGQEFIRSNTATFERLPEAPVADHASGALPAGTKLNLSSPITGAAVYYTVDGTNPSSNSLLYRDAIVLDKPGTVTVKTLTIVNDTASEVREFRYEVAAVAAPSASPTPTPVPTTKPAPIGGGGGFGGGGGGGGFAPAPLPDAPESDSKKVAVAPSGDTRTVVEVSKERIDRELAVRSGPITIDASTINENGSVDVILSPESQAALHKADRMLIVRSDKVRLDVPPANLKSNGSAGDWKLSISSNAEVSYLLGTTQGTNKLLGSYQFELSDAGRSIQSFTEPIRITFVVDSNQIRNSENAGVYWRNEATRSWEYAGGEVQPDGTVGFTAHHFSQYAVLERAVAFADLYGHWAKPNIERMGGRGIVNGVTDSLFEPQGTVTRAQFAAMLARSLNLTALGTERPFTDVPGDAWYNKSVYQVFASGIVSGVTDSSFRPDDPITREQMAIMLAKAHAHKIVQQPNAVSSGGISAFTDHTAISPWAQDSVKQAKTYGLLDGFPDGTFRPMARAARAEAVVVLERMMNLLYK